MKNERVANGLRWFDADVVELSTNSDGSYVLMPSLDVINAHNDHEIVSPFLHIVVLQPESVSIELEVANSTVRSVMS